MMELFTTIHCKLRLRFSVDLVLQKLIDDFLEKKEDKAWRIDH